MNKIISINIAVAKNLFKRDLSMARFNKNGIIGDIHAHTKNQQVTLLAKEFAVAGKDSVNLIADDFAVNLNILDKLQIGNVILQITRIGKKCIVDHCSDCNIASHCKVARECIYARVLRGGKIKRGDIIRHLPRKLKILVITLSDRAFSGEYEDRSGPLARDLISDFFAKQKWQFDLLPVVLPDNAKLLRKQLKKAIKNNIDIVFTLGGTGVGSRDITPEVVLPFCDKILPGIMENIRIKYGTTIPAALLSRSVAGIKKTTQIYTLPGSVKAVKEYFQEITKTLEHTVYMLHDIGH